MQKHTEAIPCIANLLQIKQLPRGIWDFVTKGQLYIIFIHYLILQIFSFIPVISFLLIFCAEFQCCYIIYQEIFLLVYLFKSDYIIFRLDYCYL